MRKQREPLREGDVKVVEFVKNQKEGRKPICLIEGKVAFIVKGYKGEFIQEHSLWHVEVITIKDRTLIVEPIQMIKTAAENTKCTNERMQALKDRFTHPKGKIQGEIEFIHSRKRKLGR